MQATGLRSGDARRTTNKRNNPAENAGRGDMKRRLAARGKCAYGKRRLVGDKNLGGDSHGPNESRGTGGVGARSGQARAFPPVASTVSWLIPGELSDWRNRSGRVGTNNSAIRC